MDLYRKIGIDPPRGVLLYGPPGVYLTISCHIRVQELICRNRKDDAGQGRRQRHESLIHPSRRIRIRAEVPRRGLSFPSVLAHVLAHTMQGPRMVRDVFRLARENSPCIIFIDEVDAIATKRFDAQTGSDREVQRILLELLNQMDGFDQQTSVKVSCRFCLGAWKCKLMCRSLWLRTDKTRWIPPCCDLDDWTERLNSPRHPGGRGD